MIDELDKGMAVVTMNNVQQASALRKEALGYEYTLDDNIIVDPQRRTVKTSDGVNSLQPLEMTCLCRMLHQPGQPQALAKLLDQQSEQSIINTVSKLRSASGIPRKLIRTKRSAGYYFDGKVSRRLLKQSQQDPVTQPSNLASGVEMKSLINQQFGVAIYQGVTADGEPVFVKLAMDSSAERRVEGEHSLLQMISRHEPDHPNLLKIVAADFSHAPKHFACNSAGEDLLTWGDNEEFIQTDRATRIALFRQLLVAVQVLHQLGVTHRDIKPANIFITTKGSGSDHTLCIGDLGSADVQNRHQFEEVDVRPIGLTVTEPAGVTPVYAAPEIIAGERGNAASDIYSLGTILFQLMRGNFNLPLAGGWQDGIDDSALEELIVDMTHAEKRITSVDVALTRLDRLLERRHEIDNIANYQRIQTRRPWLAATLSLVLVAAFAGYQYWVAVNNAMQEEARKDQVLQFISQFLAGTEPRNMEDGQSPSLQDALHRASAQLDTGKPEDPVIRLSLATLLTGIYTGLGDTDFRNTEHQRQIQLASQLWGEPSLQLALRQFRYAGVLSRSGNTQDAQALLLKVQTPTMLTDFEQDEFDIASNEAWGVMHAAQVNYPAALEKFLAATSLIDAAQTQAQHLGTYQNVIGMLARTGKLAEALEKSAVLSALPEAEFANYKDEWLAVQTQHAQLLGMASRPQEAIEKLRSVIPSTESMYGSGSTRLARAQSVLGQQLAAIGEYGEAEQSYQHAIRLFCREERGNPLWCNLMRGNLGAVQLYLNRPEEAIVTLRAVRKQLMASQAGATSFAVVDYFSAHAHLDLDQVQTAVNLTESLTLESLQQAAPGADWPIRLRLLHARTRVYQEPTQVNLDDMQAIATELKVDETIKHPEELAAFTKVPTGV